MKKAYEEPIIEIRNYALPLRDVVMTTSGDLWDGDDYEYPFNGANYFED